MSTWPPRPTLMPAFFKGHGLGNDYLVFVEGPGWFASRENVRRVCDRHRGVGADGIVVLLGRHGADDDPASAELRMFNPDGGEFERSGNGLRILAAYLAGERPGLEDLTVRIGGDTVRMTVEGFADGVHDVSVEMGQAVLGPAAVGLDEAALDDSGRLPFGPTTLDIVPVSIGNPHVVVLTETGAAPSEEALHRFGPFVATHDAITAGTNVQLATPTGDRRCAALIWERGVGPTAASGTSACAVAAALVSRGMLDTGDISVDMPGGTLLVRVDGDLGVVLRGPVEEVCRGALTEAMIETMA